MFRIFRFEARTMSKTPIRTAALAVLGAALAGGCALTVKSDVNHSLVGSVHCGSYAWAGAFGTNARKPALRTAAARPRQQLSPHISFLLLGVLTRPAAGL